MCESRECYGGANDGKTIILVLIKNGLFLKKCEK